ncbi:MAG: glycosyltransferase family 4 protein, partial [Anaerolineae bacterium]
MGIRYWEIACALSKHHHVTLAAPVGSHLPSHDTGRFKGIWHVYDPARTETLSEAIRTCDVLFAYPDTLWRWRNLLSDSTPAVVVDGYDITLLEHLELDRSRLSLREQLEWMKEYQAMSQYALERGDLFLVATERQRDWWLGALAAIGRVNPLTYQADPTLYKLVDLLPYGIPQTPPQRTRPVLRGVVKGIEPNDKIVLWGGGVWEWLDPLTLIQAAAKIAEQRPDVKFVFPGLRHPANSGGSMLMQQRAINLARTLGLLDKTVFAGDWVSYEDWPNYLLESDLGVSLHRCHLEARLSARTRVLSYIWAGLPMVLTRGDELAARMAESGLAVLVEEENADAAASAILNVLERDGEQMRAAFEEVRPSLHWSSVSESLRRFCDHPVRAADASTGTPEAPASSDASVTVPVASPPQRPLLEIPRLQLPAPTSLAGRVMSPALNPLVLWYVQSVVEQQNRINAIFLEYLTRFQTVGAEHSQRIAQLEGRGAEHSQRIAQLEGRGAEH